MPKYKAIIVNKGSFDNAEDALVADEQFDLGFISKEEAKGAFMGIIGCGAVTQGDEASATLYLLIDEKWVDFAEIENKL